MNWLIDVHLDAAFKFSNLNWLLDVHLDSALRLKGAECFSTSKPINQHGLVYWFVFVF
jgi:hypothetical protein